MMPVNITKMGCVGYPMPVVFDYYLQLIFVDLYRYLSVNHVEMRFHDLFHVVNIRFTCLSDL